MKIASSPHGAIAATLKAQIRVLVSLVDVLEQEPAEQPSRYLDQHTSPLSRRVYLRHARAGAFPTKRVGKRVIAARDAFDAWLSRQGEKVPSAPASGPRDVDAEALSELGLRRAGTRR